MACKISSEKYNLLPALYANAGKWVDAEFVIKNNYYVGSGTSNKITALGDTLTFDNLEWMNEGFAVGDTITVGFQSYLPGSNNGAKSYTRTITYINGNILYLSSALPAPFTNLVYPTSGQVAGMYVTANKAPEQVEFSFNLSRNGIESQNSFIDNEINRFIYNAVSGLSVGVPVTMSQMGNKSGGIIKNVQLTRLTDTTASIYTYKNYKITFKFLQWGLFEDPTLYGADNCPVPYIFAKTLPLAGNPNGAQTDNNGAQEANTGFFGENYNGGTNLYTLNGISWTDSLGNSIPKMDYSGESNFVATITAPGQTDGVSVYRIGMAFRPESEELYKNLITSAENNFMLNAPEVNFLHSVTPDPTVYAGALNVFGAAFDLKNLKFEHNAGILNVSGTVVPNSNCVDFFEDLTDGERNIAIWVQISNHLTSGTTNNEVNLLIYNDDCYDAPTLGVQYPFVVSEELFDHSGLDISANALPNTTTEDDLLYTANIQLEENIEYDGLRLAISARNSSTGEVFELENVPITFSDVPFIGGKYQINKSIARNFNLPATSDRNAITIALNPANDATGVYGVEINYGFMSRWEYWIALNTVSDDFFDLSEPNNGKNHNWKRYNNGDWATFVDLYVIKEGVEDFNHYNFKIRGYEDDPNVTATETITTSQGQTPTNFLVNDLHTLSVLFTWNTAFVNPWVEITCEDYESGNRWIVSSVLDIGSNPANPFKPLDGETKVKLTAVGVTLKADVLFDTNLVNANSISMTYRVFAEPKDMYCYPITFRKDAALAYSVYKISGDDVYNGPLMRIQRSSDNTEMDIYATPSGLIDVNAAEAFAGGGDARVSILYDQSGSGCHATQTTYANMAEFVKAGSVILDVDNNLPTWKYTGTTCFYNLAYALQQGEEFTQISVLRRNTGDQAVTLGSDTGLTAIWDATGINDIITFFGAAPFVLGNEPTTTTSILSVVHKDTDLSYYQLNGSGSGIGGDTTLIKSMIYLNRYSTNYGRGNQQELIVWQRDKSLSLAELTTNIQNRF